MKNIRKIIIQKFSTNYCTKDPNLIESLGTLWSEAGDGRENVAEKVDSHSFNLHSDYSKSLSIWNVSSQGWILKNHIQVQKEGGNFVVACVLPLYNVKLRHFHVVVVQWWQKNVQKSVHVQSCCFFFIKPIALVAFPLSSLSLDLKVPITVLEPWTG